MSSSVVVLETKAARVSLARPVHSCLHKFLETPVTQAKRGSSCVQVSFVNCPQPRSISNSPAFLACMFCFPIADHVMLPQRTISFKCWSCWFCRWLWPWWRLNHTDELCLISRVSRLYLWLKDLRSYHAQGRYDVENYFLPSCRRRGPKRLVIDFLFIVWVKNRIWVCTCLNDLSPITHFATDCHQPVPTPGGGGYSTTFYTGTGAWRGGSSPRSNPSSLSVI